MNILPLGLWTWSHHQQSANQSIVLNNQVLIRVQVVNRFQPVSRANGLEDNQQELGYKLDQFFQASLFHLKQIKWRTLNAKHAVCS